MHNFYNYLVPVLETFSYASKLFSGLVAVMLTFLTPFADI